MVMFSVDPEALDDLQSVPSADVIPLSHGLGAWDETMSRQENGLSLETTSMLASSLPTSLRR